MDCISSLIAQMMKCVCVHYQHKALETSCRILCYSIGCDTEQLRTCIQNFSCKATSTQCINYKMVLGCVLWAHDPFAQLSKVSFKCLLPAPPPGKIVLSRCLVPQSGTAASWFSNYFQNILTNIPSTTEIGVIGPCLGWDASE